MKRTREVKQAPYNPLDKLNLAKSIEAEILSRDAAPLGDISALLGAGVYAIYYTGDFPAYSEIAVLNRRGRFRQPIYVGKAIPKGGRKGGLTKDAAVANRSPINSANTQRPSRRRGICSFPISMSDILWWTIFGSRSEKTFLIIRLTPQATKPRYRGERTPRWTFSPPPTSETTKRPALSSKRSSGLMARSAVTAGP